MDLNVFSARVEKVADLGCLEGSDFQVVQTAVCVLQLQLHNSSSWTACQDIRTACSQLLWGFSGHQESGAENKLTVLLYVPGAGDELSQDRFYSCAT